MLSSDALSQSALVSSYHWNIANMLMRSTVMVLWNCWLQLGPSFILNSGEIMEGYRSKNISCVASKFGSPTIYKNENAINRNVALNRNRDLALKPSVQFTTNTSCWTSFSYDKYLVIIPVDCWPLDSSFRSNSSEQQLCLNPLTVLL